MARPGVTEDKKFLNVRISSEVIAKAKANASLSSPPLKLNEYVERMLDVDVLASAAAHSPRKGKKPR